MKKTRTTIKEIAETKVSENLDLQGLKDFFPYDWQKKVEELRKSKYKSKLFPE